MEPIDIICYDITSLRYCIFFRMYQLAISDLDNIPAVFLSQE